MDINALSNFSPQQDFPVEALPVPVENSGQTRQNPAARSLVVKNRERTSGLARKKTSDTVDISSSSGQDNDTTNTLAGKAAGLLYDLPNMRNWDHRITAWFKTAFAVQGDIPQTSGLRIDIVV
jgi:hypothetical protein